MEKIATDLAGFLEEQAPFLIDIIPTILGILMIAIVVVLLLLIVVSAVKKIRRENRRNGDS